MQFKIGNSKKNNTILSIILIYDINNQNPGFLSTKTYAFQSDNEMFKVGSVYHFDFARYF